MFREHQRGPLIFELQNSQLCTFLVILALRFVDLSCFLDLLQNLIDLAGSERAGQTGATGGYFL